MAAPFNDLIRGNFMLIQLSSSHSINIVGSTDLGDQQSPNPSTPYITGRGLLFQVCSTQ